MSPGRSGRHESQVMNGQYRLKGKMVLEVLKFGHAGSDKGCLLRVARMRRAASWLFYPLHDGYGQHGSGPPLKM